MKMELTRIIGHSYRSDYPLSILVTSVDKSLKIVDYESGEVSHRLGHDVKPTG